MIHIYIGFDKFSRYNILSLAAFSLLTYRTVVGAFYYETPPVYAIRR